MKVFRSACLASALVAASTPAASAQESTSAPLVKKLVAALDAARTDLMATKDPSRSGEYICVLYVTGSQMMVVSAKYPVPALLDAEIEKQAYNEVYMDLNTAGVPGSRVYIEDFGADGLKAERAADTPGDGIDSQSLKVTFDNDWKKQRLTQEAYQKAFRAADERYAAMLRALLAALGDKSERVASR
jgi:hypothetical protein